MSAHTRQERERGQIAAIAAIGLLIFALLAAGLVDVYRVQAVRNWAYRTAEAAALNGAALGRDVSTVYTTGQPRLAVDRALAGARQVLDDSIARYGLTGVTYQLAASEWGREEFPGFPPVARADAWGNDRWQTDEPAVGVYIEARLSTFLLNVLGNESVTIHVFAAAGIGWR